MALADWLMRQLTGLTEEERRKRNVDPLAGPATVVGKRSLAEQPTGGPSYNLPRSQQQAEGQRQLPNRGVTPKATAGGGGLPSRGPEWEEAERKKRAWAKEEYTPNLVEDPSAGMGGNPFADIMGGISESYDEMIAAIGGLGPIYEQQAAESQGRIGGFFDYAKGTAEAGRAPTRETYETASQNVGAIYDELGSRLEAAPQQAVDTASRAGGGANATSVADRVAAATAPFQAAGETGRANALANLTQHSAAGQDYLTQLASATGGEAAMHQSSIEGALNQQLQGIAFKQAELEGAKQRALAEVSADVAGDASERMANAAMAQALGLDIPEGLDPGKFLMNRNRMAEFQGKGLSQQQAMLNLAQDQDPLFRLNQMKSQLRPTAQSALESIMQGAEADYDPLNDSPEEFGFKLIENLEAAMEDPDAPTWFHSPGVVNEVRNAIRALTGPYG